MSNNIKIMGSSKFSRFMVMHILKIFFSPNIFFLFLIDHKYCLFSPEIVNNDKERKIFEANYLVFLEFNINY